MFLSFLQYVVDIRDVNSIGFVSFALAAAVGLAIRILATQPVTCKSRILHRES